MSAGGHLKTYGAGQTATIRDVASLGQGQVPAAGMTTKLAVSLPGELAEQARQAVREGGAAYCRSGAPEVALEALLRARVQPAPGRR